MESKRGIWAVVTTISGQTMLGRVTLPVKRESGSVPMKYTTKEDIKYNIGTWLFIEGYILLEPMKIPVPQSNGTVGYTTTLAISPMLLSLDVENTISLVNVSMITFLDDMSASDRAAYQDAIKEGYSTATKMRAHRSGILT